MTRSWNTWIAVWLVTAVVLVVGGLAGHRYLWSCVWRARDTSHLSLRGDVRVVSCNGGITSFTVVVALDSVGVETANAEARNVGLRRTEDVPDSTTSSWMQALRQKHGWYRSSFERTSNGGGSSVVLDLTERTVTARYAMN